jgi:serine protease SohB
MKEKFGDKVRFRVYGPRRGLLSRIGMRLVSDTIMTIEERAEYARFGL